MATTGESIEKAALEKELRADDGAHEAITHVTPPTRDGDEKRQEAALAGATEKSLDREDTNGEGLLPEPSPVPKESVEVPRASQAFSDDSFDETLGTTRTEDGRPVRPDYGARPGSQATSIGRSVRSLPPLTRKETKLAQKKAQPLQHWGITLGGPMIILFDIVVPCIIYYTWFDHHRSEWEKQCQQQYGVPGGNAACPIPKPEFDKDILGSSIASFGFGELWILIARVVRLWRRPDECAPLLSRNRWELDATCWVYGVAMILALIPFVIGAELQKPHLYLYSPTFIMGFLGILMLITTFIPFKIPIGINSHARGTKIRPFIYYAAEDFIAVDGLQDREFRIRYNERYESNRMFRQFFFNLTLWWMLGVCVYIGAVSAVIWTCEFHIAFGLSFGVLFSYIAVWAAVSFFWVKYEMKREHLAYEAGEIEA